MSQLNRIGSDCFFPFQTISISPNLKFVGDQNIAILTLKTGPLTVFFTEKRYRSIETGYIINNNSNTIPLRVCSKSELRCLTRKFAVW